ncbi:MAG: DMT family transporter [Candidatus Aenigmarchaeota archaeon]|nr:DMT family transporter [Candidatus Aenigmarchaeota archaeon]
MRPVPLAVLSSLLLGWSIVIGTVAAKAIPPLWMIALVYLVSFLVLLVFAPRPPRSLMRERAFLLVLLFRGILSPIFFITGFSLTLGIRAAFIVLLEPALVLAVGVALGKAAASRKEAALLLLLLGGSYLFVTGGALVWSSLLLGDVLVLLGLLCTALSYYPAARLSQRPGPLPTMLAVNGVAAVLFLAGALLAVPFAVPAGETLLLLGLFILFGPLLGIFLWYRSLRELRPWIVAALLTVQALASALLAFFWLGQTLGLLQLGGGIIMLVAAAGIARLQQRVAS